MAVFTLDLSDGLREKLEGHRRRLGARSLADAVRLLIDPVPSVDDEFTPVSADRVVREGPPVRLTTPEQEARGTFGSAARKAGKTAAVEAAIEDVEASGGRGFRAADALPVGPVASKPGSRLIEKKRR